MKWYFAINEISLTRKFFGWEDMIRVAIESARQNTTLQPYLIYDGKPNDFTREIVGQGVTIIPHRVSFYPSLQAFSELPTTRDHWAGQYMMGAGAFLRTEIPLIEREDEFAFYTDCDVMFLYEPTVEPCPEPFAVSLETAEKQFHINTGVMQMNLPRLRESFPKFRNYICDNLNHFTFYDQCAYQDFYRGQSATLPFEMNWRPAMGMNDKVKIVHWCGPKPETVRRMLAGDMEVPWPLWLQDFVRAENKKDDIYRRYLAVWDEFLNTYVAYMPLS